jgi:hypothetical protein
MFSAGPPMISIDESSLRAERLACLWRAWFMRLYASASWRIFYSEEVLHDPDVDRQSECRCQVFR